MQLSEIKLGHADGKDEASSENFLEMFYEDDMVYQKLKDESSVFIITGRKGVGKTLLSEYYMRRCSESDYAICKTVCVTDLQLTQLKELGYKKLEQSEYIVFLKFCILREMARVILDSKTPKNLNLFQKVKLYKRKKSLEKFVKERDTSDNFVVNEFETTEHSEISAQGKKKINSIGSKLSFSSKKKYSRSKYYNIEENLEDKVFKCLEFVNVVISNDDIDEFNFASMDRAEYSHFLICYIRACKELNAKIDEMNNTKSKSIIVIRDDILNSLNAYNGNFNKIISDCSVCINWIELKKDNPWEYKMAKMVLKKIRKSCKGLSELSDTDLYKSLFPEQIQNNDAFYYLINNSYGRPREVIFWLKEIISNNPSTTQFEENMFYAAFPSYSQHLLGDIKNEMNFYYEPSYIEQLFDLIMKIDKKTFKRQNAEYQYEENKSLFPDIISVDKALEDLYTIGVIGCKKEVNGKVYTDWSFRPDGKGRLNLERKFTVHFGLRKALVS